MIKTTESAIILIVLALITVISSLIFTRVPAKSKDWFKTEKRIKNLNKGIEDEINSSYFGFI